MYTNTNLENLRCRSPYVRGIYESALQVPTLLNSGLVRSEPPESFNGEILGGGQTLVVEGRPSDLEGDSKPLVPGVTSTPIRMIDDCQTAAVFDREKIWPISDPEFRRPDRNVLMNSIGVEFGRWLARDFEKEITALSKGVFGPLRRTSAEKAQDYALGIHTIDAGHDDSPTTLTPRTICKAKDKFGQFSTRLSMMVIHPAVHHWLKTHPHPTWQKLKIVVSDAVETFVEDSITYYATYISAPGVIITAEHARLDHEIQSNSVRFKWSDIVHMDGVDWIGDANAIANSLPRCQLASAANWKLLYPHKNVPIVRITTTAPAS